MPRNLLSLDRLSRREILSILAEAQTLRDGAAFPNLKGKVACNLFFEPSTRTQYSFCIAEEKMGMRVISFHPESSSLQKGETFYDTVKTFDSFFVDALVIRHTENAYYEQLVGHVRAPILNGGDGTGDHPTQSLLDLLTIQQEFGRLSGLKVAIIGDIRHSRVARTNYHTMTRLGLEAVVAGPDEFLEDGFQAERFEDAIQTADVVMPLRIQFERHNGQAGLSKEAYHQRFGQTAARVGTMKKHAILMHPAPFNRGVDLSDDVVECEKSRIFKQMENGVFIRMAALRWAIEGQANEQSPIVSKRTDLFQTAG